jgi:hypothetical protein
MMHDALDDPGLLCAACERDPFCHLGGPAGSSGSGGGSTANVFTPPNQGLAATDFGQLVQPWVSQGINAINQVGGYGSPYGNAFAAAQPYVGQAQGLTNQYLLPGGSGYDPSSFQALNQSQIGANYGQGTLWPMTQQGTQELFSAGMETLPLGYNQYNYNSGLANNLYNSLIPQGQQFYNQTMPIANQVAATAFDPQGALFHQQFGQAQDASGVANAISGLSGSPYAASTTADALNNFNIGWQNNLLGRQAAGGQAYSGLANTALSGLEGLTNTGVGAYNTLTQSGMQDILSSLTGGAGALQTAQQLGTGGTQSLNQLALSPYQLGQMFSGNALQGLSGLSNLGGSVAGLGQSAYQLPQQVLNDLESYMQLGQSASQISGQLGNQGFLQNASSIGGGLSGLNSLFGQNSLFGGSSGLFGGGGLGGLLGFGGGDAAASLIPGGGGATIGDIIALAGLPFGA